MGSSIRPARQWLHAQLVAALADEDTVQVSYGIPQNATEVEQVCVAGFGESNDQWGQLGNLEVDERYTIEVYVYVDRAGWTIDEVDERTMELLDVVHDVVVADPRMGGALSYSTPLGPRSPSAQGTSTGARMEIVVEIGCRAKRRRSTP